LSVNCERSYGAVSLKVSQHHLQVVFPTVNPALLSSLNMTCLLIPCVENKEMSVFCGVQTLYCKLLKIIQGDKIPRFVNFIGTSGLVGVESFSESFLEKSGPTCLPLSIFCTRFHYAPPRENPAVNSAIKRRNVRMSDYRKGVARRHRSC
jgi:hypothetical protein